MTTLAVTLFIGLRALGQQHVASDLPTIRWQASTLRLIAAGGDYPRMVRLGDGSIACAYDRDQKMWIRRSTDGAIVWGKPILVAAEKGSWLTNASLLPLKDGPLLYFWNDRPMAAVKYGRTAAPPGRLTRPIRIMMADSADDGRTWSQPRAIYVAGPSFLDGCWEPAALQLPTGEVQVYFSNEKPFETTDEQEIDLLRSWNGGKTWSGAQRVSLRAEHRDGMPNPVLLSGSRGIAVAIEDNGVAGSAFKPSIIFSSLADDWRSGSVDGKSKQRWPALLAPLDPHWYAGAPFLARLASGKILLSYQESADGSLDRCRMAVCIGDAAAQHFSNKTYPFPLGPTGNQAWNSLFVKDAHTVIALTSGTINGRRGVWAINGSVHQRP